MSNTYLIEISGNRSVVKATGFVPKGAIAKVPDSIEKEDYEFIEAKTMPADPDSEFPTEETVIAVVNTERKALVLAQREAQAIERKAKEKSKRDKRQDLL